MTKFVSGNKPGPGRPKGMKNKATVEREARLAALTMPGVVAPKIGKTKRPKGYEKGPAPKTAQPGISPKDLLLTSMRASWESAHAIMDIVREHEADIELLEKVIPGQPLTNDRRVAALLEMQPGEVIPTAALEKALQRKRDQAAKLRIDAGGAATRAQALAKDVAPYEHAKLQNIDGKLVGDLFIEIKKF